LPLIQGALEMFDRVKLQKAYENNQSISQDLEDKTNQLLEFCLNNSKREMKQIKPVLNSLHNLRTISRNFSKFIEEIKIRMAEDIMFSDRAYGQLSYLWKSMGEIFRQVTDNYRAPDPGIGEKISAQCARIARLIDQYDIEHEERLIRGICPVKASSMFLNMLDSIRGMVRCLSNISANF
jgi:Na+/phosphate symporter